MFMLLHIDKVNDDNPAHIAEAKLPCNLPGRFHIRAVNRFLEIFSARKLPGVHVNRD